MKKKVKNDWENRFGDEEMEEDKRTSCTSFVRCNDMWLAKDNRFLNPMSTYERNLMAPTCLIIKLQSLALIFYDLLPHVF